MTCWERWASEREHVILILIFLHLQEERVVKVKDSNTTIIQGVQDVLPKVTSFILFDLLLRHHLNLRTTVIRRGMYWHRAESQDKYI